jgi:hypothetical protein
MLLLLFIIPCPDQTFFESHGTSITVMLYRVFIKFILKVGFEVSIVNAPLVSLQSKNTNNEKSEVRIKQLIRDLQSVVRYNLLKIFTL